MVPGRVAIYMHHMFWQSRRVGRGEKSRIEPRHIRDSRLIQRLFFCGEGNNSQLGFGFIRDFGG